jgi:predicted aspartyl protease
VPVRAGSIVSGHPYIEILVSPDGKKLVKQTALVDTGFSGFISVPLDSANVMGLKAHATALYTLANGKTSDSVPLAHGYACLEGDRLFKDCFLSQSRPRLWPEWIFLSGAGKPWSSRLPVLSP